MSITTDNGMTVLDDLDSAPNGPQIVQQLGNEVDKFYGGKVASASALPGSGSFPGQRVWLVDVKGWAVWNGTAWSVDTTWTNTGLSVGTGWSVSARGVWFRSGGGRTDLLVEINKTTWSANEVACTIPAPFRFRTHPGSPAVTEGWRVQATNLSASYVVDIRSSGAVVATQSGTGGLIFTTSFPNT